MKSGTEIEEIFGRFYESLVQNSTRTILSTSLGVGLFGKLVSARIHRVEIYVKFVLDSLQATFFHVLVWPSRVFFVLVLNRINSTHSTQPPRLLPT